MGLMSHIDLAPKNGDFIILRDLRQVLGKWAAGHRKVAGFKSTASLYDFFQHIGRRLG
jgi:hypothetical protein